MIILKLQTSVNTTSNASKFSITEVNKTNRHAKAYAQGRMDGSTGGFAIASRREWPQAHIRD
jgi:hypothetical protein